MRRALSIGLPLVTFAVIAAAWEILATYGGFPPKLVPGLGDIAETFVRLAGNGVLLAATVATLYRLVAGFLFAAVDRRCRRHRHGTAAMDRGHAAADRHLPLSDPRPRLCAAVRSVVRPGRLPDHPAGRRIVLLHRHHQHLEGREGGQADLAALGGSDGRARPRHVPARRAAGGACPTSWSACGLAWRRPGAS